MSFSELNAYVPDENYPVAGGQQRVGMGLRRLDDSWLMTRKTTLNVALILQACVPEDIKGISKEFLAGLLGMLQMMSDIGCARCGSVTVVAPDHNVLVDESLKVDEICMRVGAKVDEFAGVIMTQFLAVLPREWTKHFLLLSQAHATVTKELEDQDSRYLERLMADEQAESTSSLRECGEKLLEDGSSGLKIAQTWVKAARGVYDASIAGGFDKIQAMGQVITTLGFPDVEAK